VVVNVFFLGVCLVLFGFLYEEIGAMGICGSGSFAISAAKIDACLKAIATASMYSHGSLTRNAPGSSQSLENRKEAVPAAS
jgi:hypothetical protein